MDVKISELPESEGLFPGCCFPVVTNDVTYKVTFEQIKNQILESIYPVGSIYISMSPNNPSTLFGGSWERIEGKFLLGSSQSHPANSTGGEENVRLDVSMLPSHNHKVHLTTGYGNNQSYFHVNGSGNVDNAPQTWVGGFTDNVGGNQAHNNMPPFLAVYMWKRIF